MLNSILILQISVWGGILYDRFDIIMGNMGNIKIVSFDLDGTLLDDRKMISPECKNWIINFQKCGGYVVLSSGRKFGEIEEYIEELQLRKYGKGFVISSSGMYLHDLYSGLMDISQGYNSEKAELIISKLLKSNIANSYRVVTDKIDYLILPNYQINSIFNNILFSILKKSIRFRSAKKIHMINDNVEKISVYTVDKEKVVLSLIDLKNKLNIRLIDGNRVEVYDKNVDKSVALRRLLSKLNILPGDLLLFGDDENDLSCFEMFENTVAMGNSVDLIKERAKLHTLSNNENGVYNILKEINCNYGKKKFSTEACS